MCAVIGAVTAHVNSRYSLDSAHFSLDSAHFSLDSAHLTFLSLKNKGSQRPELIELIEQEEKRLFWVVDKLVFEPQTVRPDEKTGFLLRMGKVIFAGGGAELRALRPAENLALRNL